MNPSVSLRVPGASLRYLLRIVSTIPGVVITRRQPWYWLFFNRDAEFEFHGHPFIIDPDCWDGVYWILSKDFTPHKPEMLELQAVVERFMSPRVRIREFFRWLFLGWRS